MFCMNPVINTLYGSIKQIKKITPTYTLKCIATSQVSLVFKRYFVVLESNFEFRSTGVTFLMVMDSEYLTKWQIINQIVVLVTLLLGHEGVHGIVLKKTP